MAKFAHYTLDEDQRGPHPADFTHTVLDSAGSNHAISFDTHFGDDDPAEGGAFFIGSTGNDGTSTSYVKIDTPSNFYLQTFSFSFWVKPSHTHIYSSGRTRTWLLSCMGTKGGWHLSFGQDNHVTFQQFEDLSAGGAERQLTTDDDSEKVVANEWKHYVATVSPSGLTLFANGQVAQTVTTPIAWDMDFTNAEVYFARVYDNSNAGGLGEMFSGALDDVQFYDHVLDATEVAAIYNAGRPTPELVGFAHYTLDADVLDSEGTNHGTANSITFNDGAAVFVAAAGSDPEVASYIELDHSAFHLQTFSFSFWVNPATKVNGAGRSGRWLASCMGPNLGWSLRMNHNRHLTFQQFSGTGHMRQCITNAGSEKAVIGEWKHYVMTVSPSSLHLYSNGTTASSTNNSVSWEMDFTGAKAYLGRVQDNMNAGGAADSFDGSLDDVQFFDHVLTAGEVTALYNAGRPAAAASNAGSGTSNAGSGKTFVFLEALADGVVQYTMPGTSKYAVMLNSGQVFTGTGVTSAQASAGTWLSTTIPTYADNVNQHIKPPGSLCQVGGFWFTHKPSGSAFGTGEQLAWANALDANGNTILPTSWNTNTGGAGGAYSVTHVYPVASESAAFSINFASTGNQYRSTLWKSNTASGENDTVTWTQLNMSSTADPNDKSILDNRRIDFAACDGVTKHVFVAQNQNGVESHGCTEIHYYDASQGLDDITLSEATVPACTDIRKPYYAYSLSKWFVGCDQGVLVSSDGAATWTLAATTFDGSQKSIYSVACSSSGTLIAVGGDGTDGFVFRSTDGGQTWVGDPYLEDSQLFNVANVSQGVFVVAGEDGALGISRDDGLDWVALDGVDGHADLGATNPNSCGLVVI